MQHEETKARIADVGYLQINIFQINKLWNHHCYGDITWSSPPFPPELFTYMGQKRYTPFGGKKVHLTPSLMTRVFDRQNFVPCSTISLYMYLCCCRSKHTIIKGMYLLIEPTQIDPPIMKRPSI